MNPTLTGFLATLIWSFSALSLAVAGSVPPFELMGISWFFGLIFLLIWSVLRKKPLTEGWHRPASDYLFVLSGITGYTLLTFFSFQYAPPFEANSLNYLWPIFLVIFIGLSDRTPLSINLITGSLMGFAGCLVLLISKGGTLHFTAPLPGHLMAIAAAFLWAYYSCQARKRSYTPSFMVPVYFISLLICTCAHVIFEQWVTPPLTIWLALFVLGLSRLAYVFWDYGIRHGDRVFLTSLSYLIPLFSTILLFAGGFGTTNPLTAFAGFLTVTGCLIVNAEKIAPLIRKIRNKEDPS